MLPFIPISQPFMNCRGYQVYRPRTIVPWLCLVINLGFQSTCDCLCLCSSQSKSTALKKSVALRSGHTRSSKTPDIGQSVLLPVAYSTNLRVDVFWKKPPVCMVYYVLMGASFLTHSCRNCQRTRSAWKAVDLRLRVGQFASAQLAAAINVLPQIFYLTSFDTFTYDSLTVRC